MAFPPDVDRRKNVQLAQSAAAYFGSFTWPELGRVGWEREHVHRATVPDDQTVNQPKRKLPGLAVLRVISGGRPRIIREISSTTFRRASTSASM
jgi:hypothetical protein